MVPDNGQIKSPQVCFGAPLETTESRKMPPFPLVSAASVGAALAAVVLLGNFAHSASPTKEKLKSTSHTSMKKSTQSSSSTTSKDDLAYYLTAMRTNLFEPPVPKTPTVHTIPTVRPMPVMQAPPDPLSGWTYTGVVNVGGKIDALLENGSNPGMWVSAGDRFMGGKVTSVSNQMVVVNLNGKQSILPISQTDNPVPLNAATSSPGAPAAGAPGAPAAPAVNTTTPGMPQRMNPRMIRQMMKRMAKMGGNMFFPNGKRIFTGAKGGK